MGLKEILAAKKAAAEAAAKASAPSVTEQLLDKQVNVTITNGSVTKVEDASSNSDSPTVESPVLATTVSALDYEPAAPAATNVAANDKPLTFAEKMALKKAGVVAAQAVPQAPAKQLGPVEIDPAMIPENEADAQAYVDIKTKIHNLEGMFDDDLKNAMSELKQALKKNPNATDLMLDADVGKMVTALRRMTHVAQVEATTKTKAGKTKTAVKLKDAPLTKEEIEAAFNDL